MPHLMKKMEPSIPTEKDMQLATESSRALFTSIANDDSQFFEIKLKTSKKLLSINIPALALQMLFSALTEISEGNAVTLIPIHAELTTQEAANILNVSRPYLIRQLEENKIPYRQVGNRKKVYLQDIIEYKKTMYKASRKTLDNLAQEGQDLDMDY